MSHQTTPWSTNAADFPDTGTKRDQLRFLLRFAILAPSSHNTQPWKFRVEEKRIDLLLNYDGWLKVADHDQRELHISIGCALENLLIAAEHFGFGHTTNLLPDSDDPSWAASIEFEEDGRSSVFRPATLFDAITIRHTNHQEYEQRPISDEVLQRLNACCIEDGIQLQLTSDPEIRLQVDDLVVRGDAIEFADPAFRDELGYWIGQGVFGTSWLMSKIGKLAVTHINMAESQAKKDSAVLMSSPVLGIITSDEDDRASQIKVGQVYERICLTAASLGVWTQPMSQILQVPELKVEVAKLLPLKGTVPQHPFRLGYAAPEKNHTPRKPVEEVLKQERINGGSIY